MTRPTPHSWMRLNELIDYATTTTAATQCSTSTGSHSAAWRSAVIRVDCGQPSPPTGKHAGSPGSRTRKGPAVAASASRNMDRPVAEAWIRAHVEPVGAIETAHERPWATVLRVPLADGVAWFKACAPVQAFEPRLAAELFARWPDRVAEVLGHDQERARHSPSSTGGFRSCCDARSLGRSNSAARRPPHPPGPPSATNKPARSATTPCHSRRARSWCPRWPRPVRCRPPYGAEAGPAARAPRAPTARRVRGRQRGWSWREILPYPHQGAKRRLSLIGLSQEPNRGAAARTRAWMVVSCLIRRLLRGQALELWAEPAPHQPGSAG